VQRAFLEYPRSPSKVERTQVGRSARNRVVRNDPERKLEEGVHNSNSSEHNWVQYRFGLVAVPGPQWHGPDRPQLLEPRGAFLARRLLPVHYYCTVRLRRSQTYVRDPRAYVSEATSLSAKMHTSAIDVRAAAFFITGVAVGATSLYLLRRPRAAAAAPPAADVSLVLSAAAYAAIAHRTQKRKHALQSPYIEHPLGVAALLAEAGFTDAPTLAAAMLHDTVEDTAVTPADLHATFGPVVGTSLLVAHPQCVSSLLVGMCAGLCPPRPVPNRAGPSPLVIDCSVRSCLCRASRLPFRSMLLPTTRSGHCR